MPTYFLDTSALVKRHVAEPGHTWVESICDRTAANIVVISEVAIVEMSATLARLARENPPRLSLTERDTLLTYFDLLVQSEYVVVQVNRAILTRAAGLCRVHPLRGYDAVQLACALTKRDDDLVAGRATPIFV
jgi:predicted nucleic acid-binding protein